MKKNQRLPNGTTHRSKYHLQILGFEWTYNYIKKLHSFVQTINSRVNRVTKLALNKVTQKHVPALVSVIENNSTKMVQKPMFYVGDYVRIAKN